MNDFMKTILNAIQSWTKKEIKNSTSDWNQNDVNQPSYVKNRTHYDSRKAEEINITFDGNVEGKEYVDTSGNGDVYFVKVSDLAPSINEIVGGTFSVTENGEVVNVIKIIDDDIFQPLPTYYIVGDFFIVLEDTSDGGLTLTKGVWVNFAPDSGSYCSNLSYTITTGELKQIDEKYLPEIDLSSKMDKNNPVGTGSFSMNRKAGTTIGEYSHAEGYDNIARGQYSHAEGYSTVAAYCSHAEGYDTEASGSYSHAEGYDTLAVGSYSHAEGYKTRVSNHGTATVTTSTTEGNYAHAEGYGSLAKGAVSHAEGNGTTASGHYSHAEGYSTIASGENSHAEGNDTTANNYSSHAEGNGTTASAAASHAEGYKTTASGSWSHAEGDKSRASGNGSHAEGTSTTAEGNHSHAEGRGTTARGNAQHVQGEYNVLDTQGNALTRGKYAHIVGNGASDTARSNAHTLSWNGTGWFQGGLQVGGNAQDDGAKSVMLNGDKEIIIASSTEGSTKQFKITVDDTGTLTVSEI